VNTTEAASSRPDPDAPHYPAGIGNVFGFAAFNALSFQMVLSSPMVLYARSLGASATVLGIIVGMMPLLVIFQIPASRHVARVGYKRFVLAGWSARVVFIFLMALVPVTEGFLAAETRLALVLFLLFLFNLSRGISSCGWLPWITSLIPAAIRGRYLAREAACVGLASFAAFVLAAAMLGAQPAAWRFAAVFGFSAVMGATSLWFLRRIPEAESPEQVRASNTPVPWRDIASHPPFRKLLRMNVAWALAVGGLSAFAVVFLKAVAHMPEDRILYLNSATCLGGLGGLWLFGSRLDRLGSKPVMAVSSLALLVISAGWALLAAGVVRTQLLVVLALMLFMGLATAAINMANTRLAMAVVPPMGRSHFFALFSVVTNVVLGVSPILWGLFIDAFLWLDADLRGFNVNRYTLFFLATALTFGVTALLCQRLQEPEARSMEALLRDILEQSPLRFWLRFWPRN
jgi:MFS family permease